MFGAVKLSWWCMLCGLCPSTASDWCTVLNHVRDVVRSLDFIKIARIVRRILDDVQHKESGGSKYHFNTVSPGFESLYIKKLKIFSG